jgi:hypothetical protein
MDVNKNKEFACESIKLLSYESLSKVAKEIGLPPIKEAFLRKRLISEVETLSKTDPVRLQKIDKMLDELEAEELIARGWLPNK